MDRIFQNHSTMAYYRSLGLAPQLDSLALYLSEQGYGRRSVRGTLICLRMLAEYFDEKSLGLDALELPVTIEDFRDYWRQRSLESYGRKPGEAAFDVYQRAIDHLIRNGQRTGSLPPAEVESKVPVPPLVKELSLIHI